MNVKQAARTALDYVSELYADEGLTDLGLEEVEYDNRTGIWSITVGFSRPWDYPRVGALANLQPARPARSLKVLRVDSNGNVLSLKDREVE